jgi:hypothetical protein
MGRRGSFGRVASEADRRNARAQLDTMSETGFPPAYMKPHFERALRENNWDPQQAATWLAEPRTLEILQREENERLDRQQEANAAAAMREEQDLEFLQAQENDRLQKEEAAATRAEAEMAAARAHAAAMSSSARRRWLAHAEEQRAVNLKAAALRGTEDRVAEIVARHQAESVVSHAETATCTLAVRLDLAGLHLARAELQRPLTRYFKSGSTLRDVQECAYALVAGEPELKEKLGSGSAQLKLAERMARGEMVLSQPVQGSVVLRVTLEES